MSSAIKFRGEDHGPVGSLEGCVNAKNVLSGKAIPDLESRRPMPRRSIKNSAGNGQSRDEARLGIALPVDDIADGGDRDSSATHEQSVPAICDHLRELHRQRQGLHRAEKSLTLQIKANCRRLCGGDKKAAKILYKEMIRGGGQLRRGNRRRCAPATITTCPDGDQDNDEAQQLLVAVREQAALAFVLSEPFLVARAVIKKKRTEIEKQMRKHAMQLPVVTWVESVRGFGIPSLAAIVGDAGDLSNYANPAKLWKRLGLAVIDGERQRCVSGVDALEHGYNPSRHAVAWNVGDSLWKSQGKDEKAGPYRQIYDARKAYEFERDPEMKKGHASNRAKRYMLKRLMRDLWRAWRDCK